MSGGCLSDDAGFIRSPQEDPMQHSADFTSLHSHHADLLRAEQQIELRRGIAERQANAAASDAADVSVASEAATPAGAVTAGKSTAQRHRHTRRGARLATR
jgi:hypothetical protein